MHNHQVAAVLDAIGTMLELQGENAFKCNAYHNAARTVEQLNRDLKDIITAHELSSLKGIGEALCEKITTLVTTGQLPYYDKLRAQIPDGLFEMLRIQSLGPKKVRALHELLQIDSIDKLKTACEAGQVAKLKGFGAKTQSKILEGIEFLKSSSERVRIDVALTIALRLRDALKQMPEVKRIEVCGSLRRRRETIKDIDLLVSSDNSAPILAAFVAMPNVAQVIGQGDTKASVVLDAGGSGGIRALINCDLRVVSDEQFPFALHYFTGSKAHNIVMRQRAIDRGLKLNEYALAGDKRSVSAKTEEDIFRALDLHYVPPEMREDTGEIDLAEKIALPPLVELEQIQGVFHNHTTWSDGSASVEEMAAAAKALGFKYLGFGDHSQSLTVANGLTPERVRGILAEIDHVNAQRPGIHLFKGTECDILHDGTMDYDDETLAKFDYVVASVHSHFGLSREEQTARVIRALEHPLVTMLGHATGRLLLQRDGYQIDLAAVIQAAAKQGKMIEINAHPARLDLDWIHCKRAKELGVMIVINPDAHSTDGLGLYRYGVDVARRGWLEPANVFNTRSLAEVKADLAERKKKGLAQLGLA